MTGKNDKAVLIAVVLTSALWVGRLPVEAQSTDSPLFDRFGLKLEGSWVAMSTTIRLDSEALGRGTTLSFEDDLGLGANKTIPTLDFEWQIRRRHRLAVRWQDINRDSTAQSLTEIQWGDYVIPVDADITLGFDVNQTFVDYTFYPWSKGRWAAGIGVGLRVMDLSATLAWRDEVADQERRSEIQGAGPLPYLYFE